MSEKNPHPPTGAVETQVIYCGENLGKLRQIPDDSIDLVYIDPPGHATADFLPVAAVGGFGRPDSSVQRYIDWMRPRVREMSRILKSTGSFYYHCDWRVDAYVRVMLDEIFGPEAFTNQIIWPRSYIQTAARRAYANNYDSILFYTKSAHFRFNPVSGDTDREELNRIYPYVESKTGRRFRLTDLTSRERDNAAPRYTFLGIERAWRWPLEKMQDAYEQGRVFQSDAGSVPKLKQYLDEHVGKPLGNVWSDIKPLSGHTDESLGYVTQKPLDLLRRIISVSSDPGDVVLDAFCGSGTTLTAAQDLGRRWIGIDASPTACRITTQRLITSCDLREGVDFVVRDLPKSIDDVRNYPYAEFESWVLIALNTVFGRTVAVQPPGPDGGWDAMLYPASIPEEMSTGMEPASSTQWIPVQAKQKECADRSDIQAFVLSMKRHNQARGVFVCFGFTREAEAEIVDVLRREHMRIAAMTVEEVIARERQNSSGE